MGTYSSAKKRNYDTAEYTVREKSRRKILWEQETCRRALFNIDQKLLH